MERAEPEAVICSPDGSRISPAFNAGYAKVKSLDHDIVGNIDGDISFEADHLEFLLEQFAEDSTLGVAGTIFKEDGG